MLGYIKTTCTAQRWFVLAQCAGLLGLAILLLGLFGGFPPQAWLFLGQVLAQLPRLWAVRGQAIVLPLSSLVLLCIALFFAWGMLIVGAWRLILRGWRYIQEQRRFEQEVREAERLARSKVQQWTAQNAAYQQVAAPPPAAAEEVPTRPVQRASRPARAVWSEIPTRVNVPANGRAVVDRPPQTSTTQQFEDDSLRLAVGSAIDPGLKRKQKPNEDNLFLMQKKRARNGQPFGIFVIADGMGGHSNGREASQLAIRSFADIILPAMVNSVENDDEYFTDMLLDGLQHANLLLHQQNRAQNADMGTTITSALLVGSVAYVANVGDSRTYLYRPGEGLSRITRDHSVVARLVNEGSITPDEVYTHPKRNQIYRCMGEKASVDADTFIVSIQTGDKLLLCSDGLWEMVRDPQIEQIMGIDVEPTQTCKYLIQAALDGGGEDNVSAVVTQVMHAPA